MKKEEKEPVAWEIRDPKPPVVNAGRSGEKRR